MAEGTLTGEESLDCERIHIPASLHPNFRAKEILRECCLYLRGIQDDRERNELAQSLEDGLLRIATLAEGGRGRAELFGDSAPLSFAWRAGGFVGGLLFHGPHDRYGSGASPTFAVTLTPSYGWRVHT